MLRLKLILFLQGSPFYDLTSAAKRLEEIAPLKTELAIVLGRQGKNKRALRLLARDIGDFVSQQIAGAISGTQTVDQALQKSQDYAAQAVKTAGYLK